MENGSTANNLQPNRLQQDQDKDIKYSPGSKKEKLWGGEFWSYGKCICPEGDATSETISINYIRKQSQNDQETETRMEQLKLLEI
jgi:hypothetical protein